MPPAGSHGTTEIGSDAGPFAASPDAVDAVGDAELVRAARRDPGAFDALYRRYLPGIYRYALVRVGAVPPAEDIAAAVFVDALVGLPRYAEQGRFAAWLFTIARRHVSAYYRHAARDVAVDDVAVAGAAEDVERLALIGQAMAQLNDDRREAVTLRFLAGLKVTDVAAAMGKGESATKMLIHRGLRQLRAILSAAGEPVRATLPLDADGEAGESSHRAAGGTRDE